MSEETLILNGSGLGQYKMSLQLVYRFPSHLQITTGFTKFYILSFACLCYALSFRSAPSIRMWSATLGFQLQISIGQSHQHSQYKKEEKICCFVLKCTPALVAYIRLLQLSPKFCTNPGRGNICSHCIYSPINQDRQMLGKQRQ